VIQRVRYFQVLLMNQQLQDFQVIQTLQLDLGLQFLQVDLLYLADQKDP